MGKKFQKGTQNTAMKNGEVYQVKRSRNDGGCNEKCRKIPK